MVNVLGDRQAFLPSVVSVLVEHLMSVSIVVHLPLWARDHRQHLLICEFRLTAEGLLPAGPLLFCRMVSTLKLYAAPFLTICN